jgi:hypothetical protein
VNIKATAASANTIRSWTVNVDAASAFAQDEGNSINANLTMGPGTHTIVVQAWDSYWSGWE